MRIQLLAVLVVMAVATLSFAARAGVPSLDEIRSQQTEIREDARAGRGIYENLSESQRAELFSKQDVALRLMEGKQAVGELNEPERIELFNQLEAIEALVNQAEDQRMVCQRVATIGTNRKQRVCKTVAQRREEMRLAQDMLNRRSNCDGCSE